MSDELETFWNDHKDGFLAGVLNFVKAVAVYIIGSFIIQLIVRAVRFAVSRKNVNKNVDPTVVEFVLSILRFMCKFILLVICVDQIGLDTTQFVAVMFSMTFAIAFAFQGMLSNFAAGFMLVTFRPINVDEYVTVAGESGTVTLIGMFASELRTPDNVIITIGNGAIMAGTIKNFSRADTRRVNLTFGISYTDDIGKALQVLIDCCAADSKRILKDPAVSVGVDSLGASEVNLFCRPWVNNADYWGVKSDVTRRVKEAFDAAGISIPFPQRDVHLIKTDDESDIGLTLVSTTVE